MALPKVITIYQALTPKERERFRLFVVSPFHNTRKKLISLQAHIDSLFPADAEASENELQWDKKAAHHFVFGEKKYNELQLNNVLSDLYQLLEKFLAWRKFEENDEQQDVMVIENLMEASALDNAGKIIKQKTQLKNKDAIAGFKLQQLADQYYFQRSRKGDNAYLLKGQQTLDIYYLSNQLRIWCELLSRSNILALDYDGYKFQRFIDFLENNLQEYHQQPTISIYYPILLWLKDQKNDAWYEGFRDKLFQHIGEFPEQEAKDIVAYVQNYCVKRINEGRNEFLHEWLTISRFMLPLKLLQEGVHISEWTYKNIVTAGVRLKEFEWTEQFIHQYYNQLAPEGRDNAYQYNLAVLYYEKHDFNRAMQLLNKVHFTDPNYYLDAKSILLKIYYDHHEYDAILSLRDTVKIYLLRDKLLSKSQRTLYKSLFNNTIKLYKLRIDKGVINQEKWQKLFDALKEDITHSSLVANKQWLLREMELLEKR
jgi:hypothetical protein